MDWKQYQDQVAAFFKSLGAESFTNYKITGARGSHAIDVYVSFKKFGIDITWICECKLWNSAIPKEKVLTLYEIVKDVGADRGFLFSEKGFQSGAIKSTSNTNISLTSLSDIKEVASEELFENVLIKYLRWCEELRSRNKPFWIDDLGALTPTPGVELDDSILIDGTLMFISLEIQKAMNNRYPIAISRYKNESIRCIDHSSAIDIIGTELKVIEAQIDSITKIVETSFSENDVKRNAFIDSVKELLLAGEIALFDDPENDDLRFECVAKMKAVGKNFETLKIVARGRLRQILHAIMRLLIDSIYLYLSQEKVDLRLWTSSKATVNSKLIELNNIVKS